MHLIACVLRYCVLVSVISSPMWTSVPGHMFVRAFVAFAGTVPIFSSTSDRGKYPTELRSHSVSLCGHARSPKTVVDAGGEGERAVLDCEGLSWL